MSGSIFQRFVAATEIMSGPLLLKKPRKILTDHFFFEPVFLCDISAYCSGPLQMIDLSPQPQDKTADTTELSVAPRHDPAIKTSSPKKHFQLFTYENAETGIQFCSRWAGPIVLLATLGLLGWWLVS